MPTDGTAPYRSEHDRVIEESLAELERTHVDDPTAEQERMVVFVNDVGLRVRAAETEAPHDVRALVESL